MFCLKTKTKNSLLLYFNYCMLVDSVEIVLGLKFSYLSHVKYLL